MARTDGLARFRVGDGPPPQVQPDPRPSVVSFQDGEVVAFDQSIANTGWVHLTCVQGEVTVRFCGSIAIGPENFPKGHEGTLLRADVLGTAVDAILRRRPVLTVVHETPPIATGRMSRPESSLVSAAVVRQVAKRQGHEIVMVSNQHSKKVLVGNGNATKGEWHQALERLPWTHEGNRPTNEGQRDAMCLALTYLIEKDPE